MTPEFEFNEALRAIESMDAQAQSALLAQAAQKARVLRLALDGDGDAAVQDRVADFERALEQAMDAETPDEAGAACDRLARSIESAHAAGLKIRADVGALQCEGALGAMTLPVLTAVLSTR